jgi:hypothetical protein
MRNFTAPYDAKLRAVVLGLVAVSIFAASPAKADRDIFEAMPSSFASGGFDGGGSVSDYFDQIAAANAAGATIEISGTCASACTMKLGAQRVCIYRQAQLWFHAAYDDYGGLNSLGTRIMLRQYPAGIRAWASRAGALASSEFTTMSGAEAIALGVADCERGNAGVGRRRMLRVERRTRGALGRAPYPWRGRYWSQI